MADESTRTLDDLSIPELQLRLWLIGMVIKEVQTNGTPEERAKLEANVIPQQAALNAALAPKLKAAREAAGESEPPAQSVQLQPQVLFGELQSE